MGSWFKKEYTYTECINTLLDVVVKSVLNEFWMCCVKPVFEWSLDVVYKASFWIKFGCGVHWCTKPVLEYAPFWCDTANKHLTFLFLAAWLKVQLHHWTVQLVDCLRYVSISTFPTSFFTWIRFSYLDDIRNALELMWLEGKGKYQSVNIVYHWNDFEGD